MRKYRNLYPMYVNAFSYPTSGNNYSQSPYIYGQNELYVPKGGVQIPANLREDREEDEGQDEQYMKSMYPEHCKKMQALIDEMCDRMEYDGSLIYDEYPDRESIELMTDQIYNQCPCEREMEMGREMEEPVETTQYGYNSGRDFVKILLLNEMYRRRRRRYPHNYRRYGYMMPYQPYLPNDYYQYYFD